MLIAAFVLSITSCFLLISLVAIFLWAGIQQNKQKTIEDATKQYLAEKEKRKE